MLFYERSKDTPGISHLKIEKLCAFLRWKCLFELAHVAALLSTSSSKDFNCLVLISTAFVSHGPNPEPSLICAPHIRHILFRAQLGLPVIIWRYMLVGIELKRHEFDAKFPVIAFG